MAIAPGEGFLPSLLKCAPKRGISQNGVMENTEVCGFIPGPQKPGCASAGHRLRNWDRGGKRVSDAGLTRRIVIQIRPQPSLDLASSSPCALGHSRNTDGRIDLAER